MVGAVVVASTTGAGGPVVGAVSIDGVPNPVDLRGRTRSSSSCRRSSSLWSDSPSRPPSPGRWLPRTDSTGARTASWCHKGSPTWHRGWRGISGGRLVLPEHVEPHGRARTRWNGLVAGLVVLVFLPFAEVLESLPKSVLAGIVIARCCAGRSTAGVSVLEVRQGAVRHCRHHVRRLAGLGSATGPGRGPGGGGGSPRASLRELHIQVPADYEDGVLHVRPSGVLYFASAPGLEDAVNNLLAEHPGTERLRWTSTAWADST